MQMDLRFQPDYKAEQEQLQFYAQHNLYDLLGRALQDAIKSGDVDQQDLENYMRDISLGVGFNMGDYNVDLRYNTPDPFGGNLDYKASVTFPFNIEGF